MNRSTDPSAALTGVSETALMTLNGRANQAGLPDAIIEDPMAIRLRDALTATYGVNYDKFGLRGQEMALRSIAVDKCAIAYLRAHPKATVVALAEGFQTGFWRLDTAIHRNCANSFCPQHRESPTSVSPPWTTAGWIASMTQMECSSLPRVS